MINYHTYIRSHAWRTKAKDLKVAAGWRCQRCGAQHGLGNQLHIHHLSYANLGRETAADVTVLCGPCHKLAHEGTPV